MSDTFTIGEWRVEPARGCLVAATNPALEVRLEPRAMQVLLVLAQRRGEVVSKEDLVKTVWEDAFVGDQVLANAVWELRRALGDDSKNARFIQTIPRRGYRLIASVEDEAPSSGGKYLKMLGGVLALLGVVLGVVWTWPEGVVEVPSIVRFEIRPERPLGPLYLPALAISADATKLVLTVVEGATTRLRLRRLDRLEETALAGTEGGQAPFISPDGRWAGFFAGGELRKVALEGGVPPVVLEEVGVPRGATWGPDDTIYFARGSGGGLWRIPAAGGTPEPVTELVAGEWTHRWPWILPGGETLLFAVGDDEMPSGFDEASIVALSLVTGERRELLRGGSFPRFAAGRLTYVREGQILAANFDPRRLSIDPPRSILEGASWYPINGAAQMALSADGSLAYVPGSAPWRPLRRLRWIDRSGPIELKGEPLAESPRLYYDPALSPDGRRLSVAVAEAGNSDLWLYDLERRTRSRLTDSPGEDQGPVWRPGGAQIAYYNSLAGPFQMYLTDASDSGTPRLLLESSHSQRPECFSPDGRRLFFSEVHPETGFDLWSLDLEGSGAPEPLLVTPYHELQARISPDGGWLAYTSNESGRREVYLRRTDPEDASRWPLSADGGDNPVWNPQGAALYYRNAATIQRVEIARSETGEPEIGRPEHWVAWNFPLQLLEGEHRRSFDVDPAGSRFLTLEPVAEAPPPIHVVLNWTDGSS